MPTKRIASIFIPLVGSLLSACSLAPHYVRHSDPLSAEEHLALGKVYDQQLKRDEALHQYEAAVRIQKKSVSARMTLGNAYFERKDFKRAETCYRHVLRIAPHDPGASNNIAMVYVERNQHLKKAEKLLQDALAQSGTLRPYILDTLANVYRLQKQYPEAFVALHDAEATAPLNSPAFLTQLAISREKLLYASKRSP